MLCRVMPYCTNDCTLVALMLKRREPGGRVEAYCMQAGISSTADGTSMQALVESRACKARFETRVNRAPLGICKASSMFQIGLWFVTPFSANDIGTRLNRPMLVSQPAATSTNGAAQTGQRTLFVTMGGFPERGDTVSYLGYVLAGEIKRSFRSSPGKTACIPP